jgi:membrane protein YdbS with pleckstrin-like domain
MIESPAEPLPSVEPASPPAPAAPADDVPWRPLAPEARGVMRLVGALFALVPSVALGLVFLHRVDGLALRVALWVLLVAAAATWGAWLGGRRWVNTRWRLDARGLQVRRGRMFEREVFVPRSRVQHMDIERGPIERRRGLATIVVHTAGTRLQALRQAGLAHADAVGLRDALVPEADLDDDAV